MYNEDILNTVAKYIDINDNSLHFYFIATDKKVYYYRNAEIKLVEDSSYLTNIIPQYEPIINLSFDQVLYCLKNNPGVKAKLPYWKSYWIWCSEKETIMIHTKDVYTTIQNMFVKEEWQLLNEDYKYIIKTLL